MSSLKLRTKGKHAVETIGVVPTGMTLEDLRAIDNNTPSGSKIGDISVTPSNGRPYVVFLSNDAGGKVAMTGDTVRTVGVMSAGTLVFTVRAENASGTGINTTFQVTVTQVAGDVTPPVFTSSASRSTNENLASSLILACNEPVAYSKIATAGTDHALFTLTNSGGGLTATLTQEYLMGGLTSPTKVNALGSIFTTYESNLVSQLAARAANEVLLGGSGLDTVDWYYYDRALILYRQAFRTNDSAMLTRAHNALIKYRDSLNPAWDYPMNWSFARGMAMHYSLTGNATSLAALTKMTQNCYNPYYMDYLAGETPDVNNPEGTDNRIQAFVLTHFIAAHVVGITTVDNPWEDTRTTLQMAQAALNSILASQDVNGNFAALTFQKSAFMTGMLLEALILYWNLIEQDARIPEAISDSLDFMWANYLHANGDTFIYDAGNYQIPPEEGEAPTYDLNILTIPAMGWMGSIRGATQWITRGDLLFTAGVNFGGHLGNEKHFNQQYFLGPNYTAWRTGETRILTGATLSLGAQNFEAPADFNGDNVYEVDIRATDMAGNSTTRRHLFTVLNVSEGGAQVERQDGVPASGTSTYAYLAGIYGGQYNYQTDIPADAHSMTTADSLTAKIATARAANKALKLAPGTYSGDFKGITLPHGLYANGPAGSVIIVKTGAALSTNTQAFGYVVDRPFVCKGIKFQNFGDVIDICVPSVDRPSEGFDRSYFLHSTSNYGFARAAFGGTYTPGGTNNGISGGVGIPLDAGVYPRTIGGIGPSVEIRSCEFLNCQQALHILGDSLILGRLDFHWNKLPGTYGGVSIETSFWDHVYMIGNEWYNCTGSRELSSTYKGHRFHTFAKIGIEKSQYDGNLRLQHWDVSNNSCHDCNDSYPSNSSNTNAAVGVDLRGGTPAGIIVGSGPDTWTCDGHIDFNEFIRLKGLVGQEDCNAIYTKIRGGTIDCNYIEDCGSNDARSAAELAAETATLKDGSETNGILMKEAADAIGFPAGSIIAMRGNTFVDMPHYTIGAKNSAGAYQDRGFVVKFADVTCGIAAIGNRFVRCSLTVAGGTTNHLMRVFGPSGAVSMWANRYENCQVSSDGGLIGFHGWSYSGTPASSHEISNNEAFFGSNVDYLVDSIKTYISQGASSSIKTGRNVLHGSNGDHVWQVSSTGTLTAGSRTYSKPTIPA